MIETGSLNFLAQNSKNHEFETVFVHEVFLWIFVQDKIQRNNCDFFPQDKIQRNICLKLFLWVFCPGQNSKNHLLVAVGLGLHWRKIGQDQWSCQFFLNVSHEICNLAWGVGFLNLATAALHGGCANRRAWWRWSWGIGPGAVECGLGPKPQFEAKGEDTWKNSFGKTRKWGGS